MPYGSIRCTYHQLKYSSPKRSKEEEKRAYLSENGGAGKSYQENGLTAEKDKTEKVTGIGRRTAALSPPE